MLHVLYINIYIYLYIIHVTCLRFFLIYNKIYKKKCIQNYKKITINKKVYNIYKN